MKKIHEKLAALGRESSRWSRSNMAVRRSESRASQGQFDPARACESDSKSSNSCVEFANTRAYSPQTRPIAVRNPQVVLFPARRAPRGDGEAGGAPSVPTIGDLRHAKVLLVEDDFIVAYDMQTMLEEQGATVTGPASSLGEARELLARSCPNVAVLDVNLNGELVFPLAEELQSRGIPYIFATAYADDERLYPPSAKQAPRLAKPVLPAVLVAQIARLLK